MKLQKKFIISLFVSCMIAPQSFANNTSFALMAITGLGTWYGFRQMKKEFREARNWNLQEEIQKQREKEANAHSLREKLHAYCDSFSVNRCGKYLKYFKTLQWTGFTTVCGLATCFQIAPSDVTNQNN